MPETKKKVKSDPKVKVTTEVVVPRENWIDFLTKYSDIFGTSYIGYWAQGLRRDDRRGWLLWEFYDDKRVEAAMEKEGVHFMNHLSDEAEDALHAEAYAAFKKGLPLPKYYYRLDEAAAIKAYAEACKKYGFDWFDKVGDANTYDVAVQLALLGEVKYG